MNNSKLTKLWLLVEFGLVFPESFGLATLKSVPFGSAGNASWHLSFKLMETVLSSLGIDIFDFILFS